MQINYSFLCKLIICRYRFVKQDQVVIARLQTTGIICLETFQEFPQMGRFTLRDEGIQSVYFMCFTNIHFRDIAQCIMYSYSFRILLCGKL